MTDESTPRISGSKWVGGKDFVRAPQWSSGRSNDGHGKGAFGCSMRKRQRFNPNANARKGKGK